MYFAITKITFDLDSPTGSETKLIAALCASLHKKFKVCVKPLTDKKNSLTYGLAIAALSHSQEQLSTLIDKMSTYCEEFGIGRVELEKTLLDHLDNIED